MPSPTRITVPLHIEAIERLRTIAEQNDISQALLISCLLMQPDDEIAAIIKTNAAKVYSEKTERRAAIKAKRDEARKMIRKLTPEQLEAFLQSAK